MYQVDTQKEKLIYQIGERNNKREEIILSLGP
jgi:hypothetical protein